MTFALMTRLARCDDGQAENCVRDETGAVVTFSSISEALDEAKDLFDSVKDAVSEGSMSEEYDQEDYFILNLETGEKHEVGQLLAKTGPLSDEEYVAAGGGKCPACGSREIEGGSIEVDSTIAWQSVRCNDCGAGWNDTYALTGYSDLSLE